MHYETRFLHRLRENFLVVGQHDYDELKKREPRQEQYVELSIDALRCIPFFPHVKYLILTPGELSPQDLYLLKGLPIRFLKIDYYSYEDDTYTLDLSLFPHLELLFARTEHCFKNVSGCHTLQTLIVQEWLSDTLTPLSSSHINAMKLLSGKLKSLAGIEDMAKLISLSISNQRQLKDCSALNALALESLEIVSCNRLDCSGLSPQIVLRLLHVSGKQSVPSVENLLRFAPNLEWLWLDQKIISGNLSPLCALTHVSLVTACRHYSHKDDDLPKSQDHYHSSILPMELAILPEAYV